MRTGSAIARWLVPAGVFQSVIVGGGYGTGREVVEFVSRHGVAGGLAAIACVALVFGIVLACSFEFARITRAYDYRNFFVALLGRAGVLYEILFMVLLVLVLAVVSAALSQLLEQHTGLDRRLGTLAGLGAILLLTLRGREFVESSLTLGTLLLSGTLLVLFIAAAIQGPDTPPAARGAGEGTLSWAPSGLQFALYNCATVPALLFATRHLDSRRATITSGFIAGLAGALPALLLHLSFVPWMPDVLGADLPAMFVVERLGAPWLVPLYLLALFVTLVQTGVGVLGGVLERWDAWRAERGSTPLGTVGRAALVSGVLAASALLSAFGIVALIARGYGLLAWGFLGVFVLPLLTVGIARILKHRG